MAEAIKHVGGKHAQANPMRGRSDRAYIASVAMRRSGRFALRAAA